MFSDALIRDLVAHYLAAAGVTHEVSVFTDPELFERWRKHRGSLTPREREHLDNGFALVFIRTTTPHEIYVNPSRHLTIAELEDTAVHEVVHIRWPHLDHGLLFDRRVIALRAGYRCGPKRERMPEAFR